MFPCGYFAGAQSRHLLDAMSAIFDFSSLLTVLLLFICTCAFLRSLRKTIFDDPNQEPAPAPQVMLWTIYDSSSHVGAQLIGFTFASPLRFQKHTGLRGLCWKASRIGERTSPYVSGACLLMAVHLILFK